MGYTKNYLLELLCLCSDEQFGQDAVEWAIMTGLVKLTYNQHQDLLTIMGRPGHPESGAYPAIVDAFQQYVRHENEGRMEADLPILDAMMHQREAA